MKIALGVLGLLAGLGVMWGVYFSAKRYYEKNKK